MCGVGACVWARVLAAPRHSWLGCLGVRVCVLAPLVPSHFWLGCPAWMCVLGLRFRLHPATLCWVAGVSVCCCAPSPCTLPLLSGLCGVGVCVLARPSAVSGHAWLGCCGVRVFVCAPIVPRHSWRVRAALVCVFRFGFRLRPATPGWGVWVSVCWCGRSPCTPPLLAVVCGVRVRAWARVSATPCHSWLGCWGVPVGVCGPLVPRHSWLGRAAWVCVFGFGFRLRPATPGWDVGVCVCWCGRSPCTPPLLAGVCRVGVCVWARVSAAPRHSGLGCWGVCVLVCALRLYPATPGWGVRCGFVCLGSSFGCAPPLLAGVLGCACWCACSPCTPPLLAGVCGMAVYAWSWVSAAPRHSWLGCWAVCVLMYALRLYSANPAWGVRCGCLCLGLGFGCAPPLLAGPLGCVCAGVRAPPVPPHSWLGCALWVCVLGLRFWLRPATPGWGLWCVGWLLPGTCSCAVVRCVLCALPGFAAPGGRCRLAPVLVPWLWPAVCLSGVPSGSALVRCASSGPVALGASVDLPDAWFVYPFRGLAPLALLGGCAGHAEASREPGSLCLPLAPAEAGALGSLRVLPVRSPAMGLSLAGPSGVGFGLRALRCFACVDPVTDASGFPYRPSLDRGPGGCTGAVSCGRRHRPFRVGVRHARVACVCACACFLGRVGRAGLPGAFWCASPFPVAVLVVLIVCSAPSGLGYPCLCCFWVFFVFFLPSCAPPCLRRSVFSGPGCLWPWRLVVLPPPLFWLFLFLSSLPPACLLLFGGFFSSFFFRAVLAVRCRAGVLWAVGRVGVCCCGPCASAGAGVRLLSVFRCPLPVPPPFVAFVLRVPDGAVLAALLFPLLLLVAAVWHCPPDPSGPWRGGVFFFLASGLCWLCPAPAAGRAVLCCGLSCVLLCGAAVRGVFCVVSIVVWRACVLALCCAGSCCAVVVVLCFRLLPRSLLFFFLRCSFPFRGAPGCFCFCALLVQCCAGVPALLLSVRCSLAPAVLAGVLCCCLLCLRVGCWAWLSSVVSWWVLAAPGVVFWWCPVVCPWVPCCVVLLRVVPPGVVWFRFALFGAVVWCVVSWGAVRPPGVLCLPALCFVVSRRAMCVLLWSVAAWCCSPLCFVPCASQGVLLCVPCPLLPVRCCCGALLSLGPLLPCAVPPGAVLTCGAVVSGPAALLGLFPAFVWFLLLNQPLQNLLKYFSCVVSTSFPATDPIFLSSSTQRSTGTIL